MIGFIAGAGIVVRNSIIVVDFIELRLTDGLPREQTVVDAGAVRFRPMALTAAAMIVGAAVILFDPIFQGLAISLMAGEVASLLSRMAVPVLYYMAKRHELSEKVPNKTPMEAAAWPRQRFDGNLSTSAPPSRGAVIHVRAAWSASRGGGSLDLLPSSSCADGSQTRPISCARIALDSPRHQAARSSLARCASKRAQKACSHLPRTRLGRALTSRTATATYVSGSSGLTSRCA
jgi:hypothetical protein